MYKYVFFSRKIDEQCFWVTLTGAAIDLGDATYCDPRRPVGSHVSHGGFHHETWWISGELTTKHRH